MVAVGCGWLDGFALAFAAAVGRADTEDDGTAGATCGADVTVALDTLCV